MLMIAATTTPRCGGAKVGDNAGDDGADGERAVTPEPVNAPARAHCQGGELLSGRVLEDLSRVGRVQKIPHRTILLNLDADSATVAVHVAERSNAEWAPDRR